nr:hypothetical protein [Tanacetum cinerariifolium]
MKNKVEAQPRKINKKNRIVEPIRDVDVKHSLLNVNSICATCKKSMFDGVHDTCLLDFVKNVNTRAKSAKKHKKNIWKPTGHVFTEVGFKWKPTGRTFTILGNSCSLTRITSTNIVLPKKTPSHSVETQRLVLKVYSKKPKNVKNVETQRLVLKGYSKKPKNVKNVGSSKTAKIAESKNAKPSEPNHTLGSNATDIPSSSSLVMTAINTTCYTQNHSLIRIRYNKTPYELMQDKKPNLSFFYVFGALCYPTNDNDDLGKLDAKADIGIFVGYALAKKAFRIYNKITQKIIETIHVTFDELTTMASEQFSSRPELHSMNPATSSSRLVPNTVSQQPCIPPSRDVWDRLFQPMFDEYFNPPTIFVSLVPIAATPRAVDLSDSPVSTLIDQDASSASIPSTNEQEHSPSISQGFEESPKTPHFPNESLHEDSTSQRSSSNTDEFGEVLKNKDRLVFQGFMQEEGIDFKESFATVSRIEAICSFIANFARKNMTIYQLDVKMAFLNDELKEEAKPTKKYLQAVKRISRYLKGTINMGLWYSKDTSMSLTAYVDADHAGYQDIRCSTSGSAQFLGDKLEPVENGIVELYFVRTKYQLADIFTKPFPRERFNFLIKKLGMKGMSLETLKHLEKDNKEMDKIETKPDKIKSKREAWKSPDLSPTKSSSVKVKKASKIKTKVKVAKSDKKKQPAKMPKAKGLDVLSKVAFTKAEQLKLATKRSKKYFHISHASDSGDGVDTQSKVPDEQQKKDFQHGRSESDSYYISD